MNQTRAILPMRGINMLMAVTSLPVTSHPKSPHPQPPPPLAPKPGKNNLKLQKILKKIAKQKAAQESPDSLEAPDKSHPYSSKPFRSSLSPVNEASPDLEHNDRSRSPRSHQPPRLSYQQVQVSAWSQNTPSPYPTRKGFNFAKEETLPKIQVIGPQSPAEHHIQLLRQLPAPPIKRFFIPNLPAILKTQEALRFTASPHFAPVSYTQRSWPTNEIPRLNTPTVEQLTFKTPDPLVTDLDTSGPHFAVTRSSVRTFQAQGAKTPIADLRVKTPTPDVPRTKTPTSEFCAKTHTTDAQVKPPTTDVHMKTPTPVVHVKPPTLEICAKTPITDDAVKTATTDVPVKISTTDVAVKTPTTNVAVKTPTTDVPVKTPTADIRVKTPTADISRVIKTPTDETLRAKTPTSDPAAAKAPDNEAPQDPMRFFISAVPKPNTVKIEINTFEMTINSTKTEIAAQKSKAEEPISVPTTTNQKVDKSLATAEPQLKSMERAKPPRKKISGWSRLKKHMVVDEEPPQFPEPELPLSTVQEEHRKSTQEVKPEPQKATGSRATKMWDAILYHMFASKEGLTQESQENGTKQPQATPFTSRLPLLLFRPRFDARKLKEAAARPLKRIASVLIESGLHRKAINDDELKDFNRKAKGWQT
ncbi:soluble scavenger receptor cysteine-rich domain-containing protein SSC5D [Callorhinchus milii]|uniref:soluble scavenger receptor cysteine-rich domain-containing protein SSC5D n=1 Tax=Callorhinchus milii TaxID=7868 RepID=UPI001C3F59D9|nr:soluble scavenger receptor cysteine-rich domain-containing protein SSC5D [Callorhinchus milii]